MIANYFDIIQRARREYTLILEPVCRQWELTRNELDVLLFLFNNPERNRAADIVSCRGIAKSHVSLSVGSLEEKQLLLRQAHPTDRRTVHLLLTQQGNRIASQAGAIQRQFFQSLFAGITPEEMAVWLKIIGKIENNIMKA